jgi:hypothetical protein
MSEEMTIGDVLEHLLEYSFEKESWQPSLSMAVDGLTASQAAWKPAPPRHSIWQIVRHVARWKAALLQAWERQPPDYDDLDRTDWQEVAGDDAAWQADVRQLHELSEHVKARLVSLDGVEVQGMLTWYEKPMPIPFMLIRVATHDIYHAGQIRYLRALQGI